MASTQEMFRLDGKVAVITGAGKGIGAAIAVAFADAGADVLLSARTAEDLDAVAKEVKARGQQAIVAPGDVNDLGYLAAVVERAVAELGGIDIVVNNAGGSTSYPLLETTVEQLERSLHFNILAPFELVRLSVPHLLTRPGSSVLNISSVAGRKAERGSFAHSLTKAALSQMTRLMAAELAPRIRVNAVLPGAIETEALSRHLSSLDPSVRQAMIANTPMRRNGLPEDIAAAAVYFCAPGASWVTGKLLEVDGMAAERLIPREMPDL